MLLFEIERNIFCSGVTKSDYLKYSKILFTTCHRAGPRRIESRSVNVKVYIYKLYKYKKYINITKQTYKNAKVPRSR